MNSNNKKIYIIGAIALCFIVGGTLSFESFARFTKKFNDNKVIKASNFQVTAISNFQDEEIKPGDIIGEDMITLTNDNDYPVEFTLNLEAVDESEKEFLKYLKLTIEGIESTEENNQYKTIVEANNKKDVYTKVEWPDDKEIDAALVEGGSVRYTYDIKAKQLKKDTTGEDNSGVVVPPTTTPNPPVGETGPDSSDESNNNINSIELKDMQWKAISSSNDNKIEKNNEYTLIGTNSYAFLEDLNFDLNTQKINFNSDIEILDNLESENGFNLSLAVKKSDTSTTNTFTYQLFKDIDDIVYMKTSNVYNASSLEPSGIKGSEIKTSELKLNISGTIEYIGGYVSCNMKVKNRDTNEDVYLINETLKSGGYSTSYKLFMNIGGIGAKEGIKIDSMKIEVVNK